MLLASYSFAQISPGELSSAHKDLEGLSNCTNCHVLGKKVKNDKCLSCHKEINNLIKNAKGFHSSTEVKGKECFECHGEHFGRDFNILNFDKDKFNHSLTTFKLDGAHSELECSECHRAKFIENKELKKRESTFIGLSTDCASCHKDFHMGELGTDCAECHNTDKFRPASFFNHDNAKFKLTGKHTNTDCEKCHKIFFREGRKIQKFTNLKFNSCENCHKDVHDGKFGKDCKKCHSTISFNKIANVSNFDHDKTNFPLLGKHQNVSCKDCHGNNLSSKPKHNNCTDCHEDYHQGDFTTDDGKITDCSVCHNVDGLTPANFGIDNHAKLRFTLSGAHGAVPCNACHYKKDRWAFRNIGSKCEDCHENIHLNYMSDKYSKLNCSKCHTVELWNKIESFKHDDTGFPLVGSHKDVKCSDCHFEDLGDLNSQKFMNLSTRCEDCHQDNHFGQFAESGKTDCSRCHTPNNWAASKFDHELTNFPLTGAHEKVECSECHKTVESGNKKFIKYKIEDISCASCHLS